MRSFHFKYFKWAQKVSCCTCQYAPSSYFRCPVGMHGKLHILQIIVFFGFVVQIIWIGRTVEAFTQSEATLCVFWDEQLDWPNSCIVHTCAPSPQCEWADESLDVELGWRTCYIVHKCVSFLRCGFWYGLLDEQLGWLNSCIVCTCVASLHCEWASASSDLQLFWMAFCIVHKCGSFLHCGLWYGFLDCQHD